MDDERKLNGPPDYLIWAIDRGHSNVMHFNAAKYFSLFQIEFNFAKYTITV